MTDRLIAPVLHGDDRPQVNVAVVIPVHNRAKMLARALRSI